MLRFRSQRCVWGAECPKKKLSVIVVDCEAKRLPGLALTHYDGETDEIFAPHLVGSSLYLRGFREMQRLAIHELINGLLSSKIGLT